MSIRVRLAVVMGGLVLVVALALSAATYQAMRSSETSAAVARLQGAAARVAGLLDASLAASWPEVSTLADQPAVRAFLAAPGADRTGAALAALPSGEAASFAEVLAPDGSVLLTTDGTRSARFDAVRPGVVAGWRAGDGAVLAGSLVAPDSALHLALLAAVASEGDTAGIVAVWSRSDTDVAERDAVAGLIGPGTDLYLANGDGSLWTDLVRPVPPRPVAAGEGASPRYVDAEGRTVLGGTATVARAPWTVHVSRPLPEVLAPVHRSVRRLLLLGVGLLGVALAAAWLLSGSLTRPIRALAGAAGAFRKGDLDPRVPVERSDELGALARTFNDLADHLARSRRDLDQRIDELTASREEHRAAEERLARVLSSSGVVLYRLDLRGAHPYLSWISGNVDAVLGADPAEAQAPRWWSDHVHPQDLGALGGWVAARAGEAVARRYRFRRGDGEYRWLRDEQRPVADEAGEIVAVAGALVDVTEHHDLEAQLRQAQKLEAVGRLAGGVAHDFNNLLTVILVEAEQALESAPPDDPVREALGGIRDAAESAAHLTRQLLTFSRKDLPQPQPLQLNHVIDDVFRMFQRMVGETVTLELELGRDVGWVRADRGQIEQVLANFLVNARDATPGGGVVRLGTGNVELDEAYASTHLDVAPGPYVAVWVSDRGVGMSKHVQEHLFEPFFTTKGPGMGTGLGLATCYAIARQLGGHIGVYSEEGVGTTVRLYLPRIAAPDGAEVSEGPVDLPRGDETILLVEDDDAVRFVASKMLSRLGYAVHEAPDGEAGLDMLRRLDGIDLILADLIMPKVGGRELAEQARDVAPGARVLFMSGYTDDIVLRGNLLEQGIVFLHKPFTVTTMATKVREALTRSA